MPNAKWPFPTSGSQGSAMPSPPSGKERLNPSQRRTYEIAACVAHEADLWPSAKDLEERAKLLFPIGWTVEIRISQQGREGAPRAFRLLAHSTFLLQTIPFEMQILSQATSRPDLACWVTRCFRVPPR